MKVSVSIKNVSKVTASLRATPLQLQKATARAIRGTLSSIRTEIKRAAAKELKVPQKVLTPRLLTSTVRNTDTSGKLWAGTWMISPFALGRPSSNIKSRVLKVGRRSYIGAFMKPIFTAEQNIWIRLNSRHYRPDLYPRLGKSGSGAVPANLRHKFPVVRAMIEVEPTMAKAFLGDAEKMRMMFYKRLDREINFAVKLEGKK
jgi:hypothetical protein